MDQAIRARPVNVTFVMEQHLGHETYYRNLRHVVDADDRVTATWVEVDYEPKRRAITSHLSFLPDRFRGPLRGFEQVNRGLRATKPDVMFFNTQVPAVLGVVGLRSTPYVVATDITPRQYDEMAGDYNHSTDGNGLVARLKHAANVRTFRRASRVVCWSNWCAESVRSEYGVAGERIEVIAPGVRTDIWKPRPTGGPNARTRILFVGGDFHRKGGQSVVDAFERLPAGVAELHLVTRSNVEFNRCDIVVHRDMSPNSAGLVSLFQSSDLFVLPSRAEAFGIAATEALACGLPVIATGSGGLQDIVDHDVVGLRIDPDDPTSMYRSLLALTTDVALRERMAVEARLRAKRLFDAERNGRRIGEMLASIGAKEQRAGS